LNDSVGRRTVSFITALLFSCNSLLARILESDNAENFGTSEGRVRVGGFEVLFSSGTITLG
jgi:hypothetical protein